MNGQNFGGAQMALDTMAGLQENRRRQETQEVANVMKMATIDPKGAANAWNRSYLGVKYGPIKYAGSKGDWAVYKDGMGKPYALNRSNGEFKELGGVEAPGKVADSRELFKDVTLEHRERARSEKKPLTEKLVDEYRLEDTLSDAKKAGIEEFKFLDSLRNSKKSAEKKAFVDEVKEKYPDALKAATLKRQPMRWLKQATPFVRDPDEPRYPMPRFKERTVEDVDMVKLKAAVLQEHEFGVKTKAGKTKRTQTPARVKVKILKGPNKGKTVEMDAGDVDPSWMEKI